MKSKIIDLRHPYYTANVNNWKKWRSVYEGGDCFVEEYLKKYSKREDDADFQRRKCMTPSAAFAKAAINDIKNSIFQRTADVVRQGGSDSYRRAVQGLDDGVDLHGSSMNTYIGREILPELLPMKRVGIYVDMPPIEGRTLADQAGKRPYLYTYRTEQICSWRCHKDSPQEFQSLLLLDHIDDCCEETGLPLGTWTRYRHIWLENGKVHVRCYDDDCQCCDLEGNHISLDDPYVIDIPKIPFVVLELTESLLNDVANNQIALMNMESSDIGYSQLANYPFYVEQDDGKGAMSYLRPEGEAGTASEASEAKAKEVRVGHTQGRKYGGQNAPAFIHPSSEPLKGSMDKQKALKEDIRHLVNLTLSQLSPKMASAESKSYDEHGLEAGLSYIGLELEHAERKIAQHWAMYESHKEPVTIQYPKKYSLQSDEDRRRDVEQLEELRDSIPSETFQKTISKQMVQILLGHRLPIDEIDKIYAEIDKATCYTADSEIILSYVEAGVMDLKLAARILGIPEESVDKAAKDHAERAKRIALAQGEAQAQNAAARGVDDMAADPKGGQKEKEQSRETALDDKTSDKTRGEGK